MKILKDYFLEDFVPRVLERLDEGAKRYPGRTKDQEWQEHLHRPPIVDFRHMWETGIQKHRAKIVEALENWPDEPDIETAQRSLESLAGYLAILHARLTLNQYSRR